MARTVGLTFKKKVKKETAAPVKASAESLENEKVKKG